MIHPQVEKELYLIPVHACGVHPTYPLKPRGGGQQLEEKRDSRHENEREHQIAESVRVE